MTLAEGLPSQDAAQGPPVGRPTRLVELWVVLLLLWGLGVRLPVEAWWVDLWRHFVVQIGLAAVVLSVWAALERRWWAAAAAAALALLQATESLGALQPRPEGKAVRVTAWNVQRDQDDHAAIVTWLRGHDATLLCAIETHGAWVRDLDGVPGLQVVHDASREGFFGAALLSFDPHVVARGPARSVYPRGTLVEAPVLVHGRPLDVLLVHTLPPLGEEATAVRDEQIAWIGRWTASRELPWVVCGDFNATYWSAPMRRLGVTRPQGSRWPVGTWPSWLPTWLGIPIDHVLASEAFTVVGRSVGTGEGSDHRLLTVDLVWED